MIPSLLLGAARLWSQPAHLPPLLVECETGPGFSGHWTGTAVNAGTMTARFGGPSNPGTWTGTPTLTPVQHGIDTLVTCALILLG